MARKIRLSQEEEIIKILNREGFREIPPSELCKEPYITLSQRPDCFCKTNSEKTATAK